MCVRARARVCPRVCSARARVCACACVRVAVSPTAGTSLAWRAGSLVWSWRRAAPLTSAKTAAETIHSEEKRSEQDAVEKEAEKAYGASTRAEGRAEARVWWRSPSHSRESTSTAAVLATSARPLSSPDACIGGRRVGFRYKFCFCTPRYGNLVPIYV